VRGCFFWSASWREHLTHSEIWVWWCSVVSGVWLCVECCIVDASILLW
jgi:hypothetical protein